MENNQGNKLGKKIKKLRADLGLSRDELACKAMCLIQLCQEGGFVKKPSIYVIAKITRTPNISIKELI